MWLFFGVIVLYIVYQLMVSSAENKKKAEGHYTISESHKPMVELGKKNSEVPISTEIVVKNNKENQKIKLEKARTYISFSGTKISKLNDSIVTYAKIYNYKIIDISISATYIPISKNVDHFAIVTFESLED